MNKHKVFLLSLGCSKNTVDSERLMAQAEASGIIFTDLADEADTILINTCGFIADAKEESITETLAAIDKKTEGVVKRVYVMGCLTELHRTELQEEMPEVDGFFGTRELPEVLAALGSEYRETVHDRVPLPRLFFGFRAPVLGDPSLDAVEVGAQILAGGKGSRLYRRLVRDEKIAQDVWLSAIGPIRGTSVVVGQATVKPGADADVVEHTFEEELERLGREPVTDDELARARALIETYELESLQHVEERADRLAMYATLLDDPAMINRQLARYLAVGKAEIQAAAAELYRAENRAVLTYLPGPTGTEADPSDRGTVA